LSAADNLHKIIAQKFKMMSQWPDSDLIENRQTFQVYGLGHINSAIIALTKLPDFLFKDHKWLIITVYKGIHFFFKFYLPLITIWQHDFFSFSLKGT
jgi:hypothetical protein